MKNRLIAEFIGTYFLYLLIALCISMPQAQPMTPLAVGLGLAALIYACGHISKAHFNPATTLTFTVAGTHERRAFLPYVAVILLAAVLAALSARMINPELHQVTILQPDWGRLFIAEFLFTFVLMWVVVNVAIAHGTQGNPIYGFAIGAVVTAGAYAVGPVSFAAFNPAVALAMAINGYIPWDALWLYWLGQGLAAASAGLLFRQMGLVDQRQRIDS
ncbi:MAG: aquaporin [Verrucomicrobiota bacterium]